MSKKSKFTYIFTGFIAGIVYIIACSGGSGAGGVATSIAASIGNAVDVLFDNKNSGLTATNTQAAIDEVMDKLSAKNLRQNLIGTLVGTEYGSSGLASSSAYELPATLTFNEDGTFACEIEQDSEKYPASVTKKLEIMGHFELCTTPMEKKQWDLIGHAIRIYLKDPNKTVDQKLQHYYLMPIVYLHNDAMERSEE